MIKTTNISNTFNKEMRKFVTNLGRPEALVPVILLETTVTGGRTYQAHKRGGFVEARERGTEEVLGAIFWLGGVHMFNKLGDIVGKRLMKVSHVDFEVGKDAYRNPLKNYMKEVPKYGEKTLAAFKFGKIATSIILANSVIGFVVPKINQAITKKYQGSVEKLGEQNPNLKKGGEQLDTFVAKTSNNSNNIKQPSFSGNGVQSLLTLTNNFENDARYKLLSTDVGIAGGRAINARNKHERREILFRDLSSIYFYMFCKNNLNSVLNKIQTGRSSRLDPVSVEILDEHLTSNLKDKPYNSKDFEKAVFGNQNAEVPQAVQKKIKDGIISLGDFEAIEKDSKILNRAKLMSQLQPQLEGVSILSPEQLKDVYSGGLINDPEFLNKIFVTYSEKKSTDPMKFFAEKDLRKLKQTMVDYVGDIIKKASKTGKEITFETIKKANKRNLIANGINLGSGFLVSAFFLSTAIPKIQYWITKRQTGEDKFPGVEKYKK